MDLVISGKWLVQFCELTKELSSSTRTRFHQGRKVSWEILTPGTLFWTLPLRCEYSKDPLASCGPPPLLLKTAVIYHWEHPPSNCCLRGLEKTPLPLAEWGNRRFTQWNLGTPVLAQNYFFSRLFPGSTQISSTLPLSRPGRFHHPRTRCDLHRPGIHSETAANLTFKAARAGPRPAPVPVRAHSFRAGPHVPARAALQALPPRALPAAHSVPNPVWLVNLKSNLKRVFLFFPPPPSDSSSHLHRHPFD